MFTSDSSTPSEAGVATDVLRLPAAFSSLSASTDTAPTDKELDFNFHLIRLRCLKLTEDGFSANAPVLIAEVTEDFGPCTAKQFYYSNLRSRIMTD